jgi:hypothetical protein
VVGVDQSRDVVAALIAGGEESRDRLETAIEAVFAHGILVPLENTILWVAARYYEGACSLSPQDALVLASVRFHAERASGPKCFLTQDANAFDNPTVREELADTDCKVFVNFTDAAGYIKKALRSSS